MMNRCNTAAPQLRCGARILDLAKPQIMAVVNVTPDSFSDGGQFFTAGRLDLNMLLPHVEQLMTAGASIIDIGGESTRPGALLVSETEELARVVPAVEAIAARFDIVISVDSSTPAVIRQAADCGAGLLNDVRALSREGAMTAAAATGLPVCLMHMQGQPGSMQVAPAYQDIVAEVQAYLLARVDACIEAGIEPSRIVLDPGFGFGKTLAHNLQLFGGLRQLEKLGFPLLVGVSRKSMIGEITGRAVAQRVAGSIVMAALAVERGASIVRVHDVSETADALAVVSAVMQERQQ